MNTDLTKKENAAVPKKSKTATVDISVTSDYSDPMLRARVLKVTQRDGVGRSRRSIISL